MDVDGRHLVERRRETVKKRIMPPRRGGFLPE
jgi:hypothetical protein